MAELPAARNLTGEPRSPGGPAWLIVAGGPVMVVGAYFAWTHVLATLAS